MVYTGFCKHCAKHARCLGNRGWLAAAEVEKKLTSFLTVFSPFCSTLSEGSSYLRVVVALSTGSRNKCTGEVRWPLGIWSRVLCFVIFFKSWNNCRNVNFEVLFNRLLRKNRMTSGIEKGKQKHMRPVKVIHSPAPAAGFLNSW